MPKNDEAEDIRDQFADLGGGNRIVTRAAGFSIPRC